MSHEEIVTRLSRIAVSPSEVVYAITMQSVLSEIARRMGEDGLYLLTTRVNHELPSCTEIDAPADVIDTVFGGIARLVRRNDHLI
jgi:hypothetical protein